MTYDVLCETDMLFRSRLSYFGHGQMEPRNETQLWLGGHCERMSEWAGPSLYRVVRQAPAILVTGNRVDGRPV